MYPQGIVCIANVKIKTIIIMEDLAEHVIRQLNRLEYCLIHFDDGQFAMSSIEEFPVDFVACYKSACTYTDRHQAVFSSNTRLAYLDWLADGKLWDGLLEEPYVSGAKEEDYAVFIKELLNRFGKHAKWLDAHKELARVAMDAEWGRTDWDAFEDEDVWGSYNLYPSIVFNSWQEKAYLDMVSFLKGLDIVPHPPLNVRYSSSLHVQCSD